MLVYECYQKCACHQQYLFPEFYISRRRHWATFPICKYGHMLCNMQYVICDMLEVMCHLHSIMVSTLINSGSLIQQMDNRFFNTEPGPLTKPGVEDRYLRELKQIQQAMAKRSAECQIYQSAMQKTLSYLDELQQRQSPDRHDQNTKLRIKLEQHVDTLMTSYLQSESAVHELLARVWQCMEGVYATVGGEQDCVRSGLGECVRISESCRSMHSVATKFGKFGRE